jgi:hypothetical protein
MVTKRIPEKKFPSSATLKKVREELSDLAYKGGTLLSLKTHQRLNAQSISFANLSRSISVSTN